MTRIQLVEGVEKTKQRAIRGVDAADGVEEYTARSPQSRSRVWLCILDKGTSETNFSTWLKLLIPFDNLLTFPGNFFGGSP